MEKIIEVCCGSFEDALAAERGGAKRIELNSALFLGGLTPSVGSLKLTKENTGLKVIAMVRPRAAGFCYGAEDFETMKADAEILMQNGADGIAFGCLDADGNVEVKQTEEILKIIKKYQGEAVFHRAFDCVKNPYETVEKLIEMGVDRILTSGLKAKAMDGKALIKELQQRYGESIQLLAGCGMNAENAREMMEYTGISQVHSSCKGWRSDETTIGHEVSYAYAEEPHQKDYDVVDEKLVRKIVEAIAE